MLFERLALRQDKMSVYRYGNNISTPFFGFPDAYIPGLFLYPDRFIIFQILDAMVLVILNIAIHKLLL